MFKFVLLGDAGVGKTSIARRILGKRFRKVYHKTIGVDISHVEKEVRNRNIVLTLWDLAGDSQFRKMRQFFFQGTTGVLLVLDVTKELDYESLMSWFKDIDAGMASKINIALIANKIDLKSDRIIPPEFVEGTEMILGDQVTAAAITSFEVSAKTGEGCHEALDWLLSKAVGQVENEDTIRETVFAHDHVMSAMFKLTEMGPDVMYQDFETLPDGTNPEVFLMNMSVSLISAIGQGHSYSQGVFDLPSGKLADYRSFVYSFRMSDPEALDPRLKWGFFQLVIFIPEASYQYYQPFSKVEEALDKFVAQIPSIQHLTNVMFNEMKLLALEEFARLVEFS